MASRPSGKMLKSLPPDPARHQDSAITLLHGGDVFAIDLRNAPHVLAPRLEVVLGQTSAHCLAGDAVELGEPDQFIRQQLEGPTGAALRWVRTGSRDQQGFLLAR